MRQLTSVDAQILAIEDGRNRTHISSLAIYDPSTTPSGRLTLEAVRELVENPWPLADALERAQAELLALVPTPDERRDWTSTTRSR